MAKKESLKNDPEFVLKLMEQNRELCKQVDALNLEMNKIRIPNEMTPKEFNWCINHLTKVKVNFGTISEVPQPVYEGRA